MYISCGGKEWIREHNICCDVGLPVDYDNSYRGAPHREKVAVFVKQRRTSIRVKESSQRESCERCLCPSFVFERC